MVRKISHRLSLFLIFLFFFSTEVLAQPSATVTSPQDKNSVEIFKEVAPSVVYITTQKHNGESGIGSGFIVRSDGVILTNYHVISGAQEVTIRLNDGRVLPVISIIEFNRLKDICVFKIDSVGLPTISLADSNRFERGQKIYVIGNPLGLEYTISDGLLSGDQNLGYMRQFQISAPISSGNSGGPLINTRGEVMGIIFSTAVAGQNVNFAIPINEAKPFIKDDERMPFSEFVKKVTPADFSYDQGLFALQEGQIQDAEHFFRETLNVDASFAEAYLQLALLHGNSNDIHQIEKAIENGEWAIFLDRENSYYHYIVGYYWGKKFELSRQHNDALKSQEYFNRAIELNPHFVLAYEDLGGLHIVMNQLNEAEKIFRKALEINPASALAYNGLGNISVKRQEYDKAISDYKTALGIDPNLATARYNLCLTYIEKGDKEAAFDELNKIQDYASRSILEEEFYKKFGSMAVRDASLAQQSDSYSISGDQFGYEDSGIKDDGGLWSIILYLLLFILIVAILFFVIIKLKTPGVDQRNPPTSPKEAQLNRFSSPSQEARPLDFSLDKSGQSMDERPREAFSLAQSMPPMGDPLHPQEYNWALLCHLSGLTKYFLGPIYLIIPFILWLVKRNQFRFVD